MESIIYIMQRKFFRFQPAIQLLKVEIPYVLVLITTWILMTILVNPLGNFPLNDDWAYGQSVQSLVEKGNLKISPWSAANLLSQVFWGALFCLPFGFSFTALRFSTLTLGALTLPVVSLVAPSLHDGS
ncbi:hypothetical protein [Nostoc sp.]|uniref:hypothetical protein n=1 Tax=Nostoc sp. TaxID=1180 RepID=UPI002FF56AC5